MTGPSQPAETPDPIVTTMRLRAQPKPVLRLSRKVLIAGGAVTALAVAGALTFAMVPPTPKAAAPQASKAAPTRTPTPSEALNGLPRDYTSVPQLGPPLLGDLGRPMLAASQSAPLADPLTTSGPVPTQASVPTPPPQPISDQPAQARTAAYASQLFFAQAGGPGGPSETNPASPSTLPIPGWPASAAPTSEPSEADRKVAFLNRASDTQIVSDNRLSGPTSPYTLLTGSVVPAALITGLRSDIPGQVLAQVTQDVRDSLHGRYVLIPRGARLIGQYDNRVSFGQSRILLVWSRLILPNGKSLRLDQLSAADAQGQAGLADRVDNHWGAVINAAALSTLLGIGAQTGDTQGEADLLKAIRDGAGDSINRAGQRIVERQLNVQPTVTIRPGMSVRVILSRDLILEPYGE